MKMKKMAWISLLCFTITFCQSKRFMFQMHQIKRQAQSMTPTRFITRIDSQFQKFLDLANDLKQSIVGAFKGKQLSEDEYLRLLANYFALKYELKTMQAQAYKVIAQAKQKEIEKLQRNMKLYKIRTMGQKRYSF